MVSAQRDGLVHWPARRLHLSDEDGARVAAVGAQYLVLVHEHLAAGGAAEDGVDAAALVQSSLCLHKRLLDRLVAHICELGTVEPVSLPVGRAVVLILRVAGSVGLLAGLEVVAETAVMSQRRQEAVRVAILLLLLVLVVHQLQRALQLRDLLGEYLRQVDLHVVADEMSLRAMAIADAKHPQILEIGKVFLNDERVLIDLLLARDPALPCAHRVAADERAIAFRYLLLSRGHQARADGAGLLVRSWRDGHFAARQNRRGALLKMCDCISKVDLVALDSDQFVAFLDWVGNLLDLELIEVLQ